MGIIKPAHFAHPFIAIMYNDEKHLAIVLKLLNDRLGDYFDPGPKYLVTDFTDYYVKEFGEKLQKQFFIFKNPVSLENFHKIKIWTNEIELKGDLVGLNNHQRWTNLDPGYLEPSKLVLFSTKNYSHRIYINDGIYGEVTMLYEHGKFKILPWTYPDYYWEPNYQYLLRIRLDIVKIQRSKNLLKES